MSVLVDDKGKPKNYVVVDIGEKVILGGYQTIQDAGRELAARQKSGRDAFAWHNLTHSKCPDWLKELVAADKDYCAARAAEFSARAERHRREAAASLLEAGRYQDIADKWNEMAADDAVPGMGI